MRSHGGGDGKHRVLFGDSGLQTAVLENLEGVDRYNDWLASLALPHLGQHPLEIGGGIGGYTSRWLQGGVPRVTTTEVDDVRLTELRERFADDERISVHRLWFGDDDVPGAGRFSSLVSYNVLEHVADDVGALASARRLVVPGGRVVVFVPAFPALMSRFDRSVGHVRRYTRHSLTQAFGQAGIEVDDVRYVNAPGFLAWWLGMRVLGMTPRGGPVVSAWDRFVVPAARTLERRVRVPFGQSVLALGTVPR